jgi:hypothetical protein
MVDGINLSCNVVALSNRGQRVTERRLGSPGRRSLPRRRPAVNGGLSTPQRKERVHGRGIRYQRPTIPGGRVLDRRFGAPG